MRSIKDLRENVRGNSEQFKQVFIPLLAMDVEQAGAAGIGGVGPVDSPSGQAPQQKAVDGAKQQFAALGSRPGPGDFIQQPGQLGGGKIGVQQQPRALPDQLPRTGGGQLAAVLGGAPVLPDDGVVFRPAAC